MPPCRATSAATYPIRAILRSRSARENDSPADSSCRTRSPSSSETRRSPRSDSTSLRSLAIVDLPDPDSPVRNSTRPRSDRGRRTRRSSRATAGGREPGRYLGCRRRAGRPAGRGTGPPARCPPRSARAAARPRRAGHRPSRRTGRPGSARSARSVAVRPPAARQAGGTADVGHQVGGAVGGGDARPERDLAGPARGSAAQAGRAAPAGPARPGAGGQAAAPRPATVRISACGPCHHLGRAADQRQHQDPRLAAGRPGAAAARSAGCPAARASRTRAPGRRPSLRPGLRRGQHQPPERPVLQLAVRGHRAGQPDQLGPAAPAPGSAAACAR